MRRAELRNAPFRETSRKDSKEGGARNGVGRRAEPQAIKGGQPRAWLLSLACSSPLRRRSGSGAWASLRLGASFALVPLLVHGLVHALSSCGSAPPVVQLSSCGSALLLWFSSPPVVQLVLWFMRSWSCERPGHWRRGLVARLCWLCGAA